jgi:hypothetical protein
MKPCSDCPFRKKSIKGWLGEFENAEAIIKIAVSELPFSCHKLSNDETNMLDINEPQCVGRLLFATKTAKIFRNQTLETLRQKAKADNPDNDILGYRELKAHHSNL